MRAIIHSIIHAQTDFMMQDDVRALHLLKVLNSLNIFIFFIFSPVHNLSLMSFNKNKTALNAWIVDIHIPEAFTWSGLESPESLNNKSLYSLITGFYNY